MAQLSRYHRIHKYPNGATLIYYKQNVNNTTKFLAGYLGGAKQDIIPGTAHFLEHMICKETPQINKEFIASLTKQFDVDSNAYTGAQYIMLYADVPNRNLDAILELDSTLLFNTQFKEDSIDLERGAIDEEINMSLSEGGRTATAGAARQGIGILNDAIEIITISNEPEDFSILGTHEDIAKINGDVLKEYADRVFVSENMVITVVSSLEFDEIKEKMDKYFVSKAKSDPTKRVRYQKTKYYPPSNYIVKDNTNAQKTVEVAVSFMSRKPEKDTRLYSYVEDYIFNGFAGRLLNEIRYKKGLVYMTQFVPLILPNNMSLNTIYATTSKEKVNETIKTIGEIIKDIAHNGVTQQELSECQNMIITREEDRRNGLKTIDPFMIFHRYLEGTEVFFNNQIHRVKELSLDTVNKYLTDTYSNANMFVTIKGDLPEDCYAPYQIQKILNARLSQVSCDMMTGEYRVFETGEKITQKKAFEITNGVTKNEKLANIAFVLDTTDGKDVQLAPNLLQTIFDQFSVQEKVLVTNELLKNLGIDFAVQLVTEGEGATEEIDTETEVVDVDNYDEEDTNDVDAGEDEEEIDEDYENDEPYEYGE